MESWRNTWRSGIAPLLSNKELEVLRDALQSDDPKLVQGCTSIPQPLQCTEDWDVEAACALSYCGWKGQELTLVGDVEEFFARTCFEADQLLGEPAGVRHFLHWFDDNPREEVFRELLHEVNQTLQQRS